MQIAWERVRKFSLERSSLSMEFAITWKRVQKKKFTYPRGVFNTTEFAITWEKSPEPIFITLEVFHSYAICNQLRKESGRNFSPSVFTRMESEDVIPSPFSENDFSFSKNAADATFIFSFSYNWCHKPPQQKDSRKKKHFSIAKRLQVHCWHKTLDLLKTLAEKILANGPFVDQEKTRGKN